MSPAAAELGSLLSAGIAVIGFFIGCTGIGGVALVPLLTVAGMPMQSAVPISLVAFLATGLVGACMHRGRPGLPDASLVALVGGGGVGALVGAYVFSFVPIGLAEGLLVAVMLMGAWAGLAEWRGASSGSGTCGRRALSATALAAFAFITGFGSAITGTGGPVILVPLLLHAGVATPLAVAAGQIAVIPIALLASIGHVAAAEIPWRATVLVASVLAGAAFLGTLAGRRLDARRLRLLVGVILLVLALVYGIHLLRSSSVI